MSIARISKPMMLLLMGMPIAWAAVPDLDSHGSHTIQTVWLEGGLASGISDGSMPAQSTSVTDPQVESSWSPAGAMSVEYNRTSYNIDGLGTGLGFGIRIGQQTGQQNVLNPVTSGRLKADFTQNSAAFFISPSLALRWDPDDVISAAPKDWQVEVAPYIGAGFAKASFTDGGSSNIGPFWQGGVQMRLSYMITRTCRAGIYAGGEFNQSYLEWGSSGTSNLKSLGPVAGITIGWEK